jgi:hypothetical protein
MQQETITIDYGNLIREPSTAFKVYLLFLLVVCVVTCAKLVRVWKGAPPFRASAMVDTPEYRALLHTTSRSLHQWIGSVVLAYGLLISTSVYNVCRDVLNDNRVGGAALFFVIQDYAAALSVALFVISLAFLARWHMLRRIERLGDSGKH